MDLGPLLAAFPPDVPLPARLSAQALPWEVAELVSVLGGVSLAGGLYRVFTPSEVASWTCTARSAFPALAHVTVFAADWLGRLFGADEQRLTSDQAMVVLLEPGTGEALELPVSVAGLHTHELLEAPDAALAAAFYREWRTTSGYQEALQTQECVGYKVPLFLGGSDTTENLERTDMNVYWHLFTQMRQQLNGAEKGTRVQAVVAERPKRRFLGGRG